MAGDKKKTNDTENQQEPLGFIINEKGEEVPITEEMVLESMNEAKFNSIGAHTGHHKVVTDDMIKKSK